MRSIPQYLLKTNPSKPIIQYQFWFWCMSSRTESNRILLFRFVSVSDAHICIYVYQKRKDSVGYIYLLTMREKE